MNKFKWLSKFNVKMPFEYYIVSAFTTLKNKHYSSIEKIRLELESTSDDLILEKYIDCLNYYILFELFKRSDKNGI